MSFFARGRRSAERDVAWELLTGCLVGSFARELKMTTGTEPDVTCKHDDLTLGVECKVMYSDNPDTQVDAIVSGAKQLEASNVDFGFVAAFATNAVRPGLNGFQRFPIRAFSTQNAATKALQHELLHSVSGISQESLIRRLTSDRTCKPRLKTRGVLYIAQAAVDIGSVTTSLTTVVAHSFRNLKIPGCESFLSAFIRSTQLGGN
jgi:hypothetical protein